MKKKWFDFSLGPVNGFSIVGMVLGLVSTAFILIGNEKKSQDELCSDDEDEE